jgi:hypothetical protein
MAQPRKVPLGQPLEWSDADLDTLSQISPQDVQAAQQRWRNVAPTRYRNLLDAVPVEDDAGG